MLTPGQQFGHSQNILNMTMGAIGRENQSRVAQSREMTRMQFQDHQKRMEYDMLLKRLQHEREMEERRMEMERDMASEMADRARGVTSSTRWRRRRK
jgi:hypothetical protein